MFPYFRHLAGALIVSALLVAPACGDVEPVGDGSLSVRWQVSPAGCDDAGVEVVEIRASGPGTFVDRYACDREVVELSDVPTGVYEVELLGYDADGKSIFEAESRRVTVETDRTASTGTMRLLARPAAVTVQWTFSNGRVCGANGVEHVVVAVFDDLAFEVARERFDCDAGSGRIDGLRGGAYLLEVNAVEGVDVTWRGTDTVKAGRGDELVADIEVSPVD